jgi:transposase
MRKRHVVKLDGKDRQVLQNVIRSGRASARKITRARILLKADVNGDGWSDPQIVEALEVGRATVERVRKNFAGRGLGGALENRPQPARPEKRRLDGDGEAHLIALACSSPPAGREQWTLQLLADRMVQLKYTHAVSYETVRQVLKKTNSSRG